MNLKITIRQSNHEKGTWKETKNEETKKEKEIKQIFKNNENKEK